MDVFIVRPFGEKKLSKKDKATGKTLEEVSFNFNKVEEELIAPALANLNLNGGTTGKIFEPGEIREDMFSFLLLADIVIADITMHNANVFYELGIRHALRDQKTILIKCPGFDETPFDILGYRYVSYSQENPADGLTQLIQTLEDAIHVDRKDSPVFSMLPKLEAQEPERFLAVPPDFIEEAEIAKAGRQIGKLALLAAEAEDFSWKIPALRIIGEIQFRLKDFEDARLSWEKVKKRYPDDPQANDRLATVYQRLAEEELNTNPVYGWELLAQSDLAIKRLLDNMGKFDKYKRAEIYSLKARNAKARWLDVWRKAQPGAYKTKALQSTYLKEAYEGYEKGYFEDLNHFYSGINALGMLTVLISLAEKLPEEWEESFDTPDDAALALKKHKDQKQKLATLVLASIEAEKRRKVGEIDPWLNMTEADLVCLISTKPQRVRSLYERVILDANDLNFDSAKRQLLMYEQLEVQRENVKEALSAFAQAKHFEEPEKQYYILFTGHMIDKPGRKEPRFPPDKESVAKAAIKEAVQKVKGNVNGPITGVSGGACGGDILFLEVCEELGIPTELELALPREQFLLESVQFAGPQWVERFDRLYTNLRHKVLAQSKELPNWLRKKKEYSIWERNNLWMLHSALASGGIHTTLIALWNGEGGDGPGGTKHMVEEAQERGAKTIILNTKELFRLK